MTNKKFFGPATVGNWVAVVVVVWLSMLYVAILDGKNLTGFIGEAILTVVCLVMFFRLLWKKMTGQETGDDFYVAIILTLISAFIGLGLVIWQVM